MKQKISILLTAQKLQKKASKIGFDWEKINDVFKKLDEEINKLKESIKQCKVKRLLFPR